MTVEIPDSKPGISALAILDQALRARGFHTPWVADYLGVTPRGLRKARRRAVLQAPVLQGTYGPQGTKQGTVGPPKVGTPLAKSDLLLPDLSPDPESSPNEFSLINETSVPQKKLAPVLLPPVLVDGEADSGGVPFAKIIRYLNTKAGRKFAEEGPKSIASRQKILALWRRGYRGKDFRTVIDFKCEQWGDDPQWRPYLRPETLFAPTHFEGYLHGEDE